MKTWKDENGNEVAVDAERVPGLVWLRVRDARSVMALAAVRLAPDAAREVAAELLRGSHRGAATQVDKLDTALAHQQQLNAIAEAGDDQPPEGYTIDEAVDLEAEQGLGFYWSFGLGVHQPQPYSATREDALRLARLDDKHRRAIGAMIELFDDRDRIELYVEHGGGLLPARLEHGEWHVQGMLHDAVALIIEVEVPALRGGDPDPVAYSLTWVDGSDLPPTLDATPIVEWAGELGFVDAAAWKAGEGFPLKLAVELLAAEMIPEPSA